MIKKNLWLHQTLNNILNGSNSSLHFNFDSIQLKALFQKEATSAKKMKKTCPIQYHIKRIAYLSVVVISKSCKIVFATTTLKVSQKISNLVQFGTAFILLQVLLHNYIYKY